MAKKRKPTERFKLLKSQIELKRTKKKHDNESNSIAPIEGETDKTNFHVTAPLEGETDETNFHVTAPLEGETDKTNLHITAPLEGETDETNFHVTAPLEGETDETNLHATAPLERETDETNFHVTAPLEGETDETNLHVTAPLEGETDETSLHVTAPLEGETDETNLHVTAPLEGETDETNLHVTAPLEGETDETNLHVTAPLEGETDKTNLHVTAPLEGETDKSTFTFYISQRNWENIRPEIKIYGGRGKVSRRLKGKWTDVFSEEVRKFHKGCTLSFKTHNVKRFASRKTSAPFLNATAICTGTFCNGKFGFLIREEPDNTEDVCVVCSIKGKIKHKREEINRRHITGEKRVRTAEDVAKTGSVNTFYNLLLESNKEELKHGNFTAAPNPNVIRKIVSEQVRKEYLHDNVMAELQLLKEAYESENDAFIREIGLDPFTMILFSDRQIELLKQYGPHVSLHLDATGSVVMNMPGQKRPYLYSLVMQPNPATPPVSIADMISCQHTIPRIEYFLSTVYRAAKLTGKKVFIHQIETDFSYPLIQASLKTFNDMQLKKYLSTCYNVLHDRATKLNFTVVHLCAAHMFKDFTRQLKKYYPNLPKKTKLFTYKCFALLQNASSMENAKDIFKDMCQVFMESKRTESVEKCIKKLQNRTKDQNEAFSDDEDSDMSKNVDDVLTTDIDAPTIRDSSPFHQVFQRIVDEQQESGNDDSLEKNIFFCRNVIICLLERFMFLLPLWTGIILSIATAGKTRNTNSEVEAWFKVLKNDCLRAKGNRPAKFVISLRKLVYGRIMELDFPGARKAKTKSSLKRKTRTETDINLTEEVWNRKRSKKSTDSSYQPVIKTKLRTKSQQYPELPKVATWGGNVEGQFLSNTCTIDNGLTILHLKAEENEAVKQNFRNSKGHLFTTLLSVLTLMSEECFSAAKLIWVNFTEKFKPVGNVRDLHGDESDLFFSFFDQEWKSRVVSSCQSKSCPEPYKEIREMNGITVSLENPVQNMQEVLDVWLEYQIPCWASNENSSDSEEPQVITKRCSGRRVNKRLVQAYSPILILRVVEHFLYQRLNLDQILLLKQLKLHNRTYALAGCTLHNGNHFCAIVTTSSRGNLWYDGLQGRLMPVVKDLQKWTPSHVVYCQDDKTV